MTVVKSRSTWTGASRPRAGDSDAEERAIGDAIVGEIGEVLIGKAPGRGSESEITVYKSLGIAVEDVAAARSIYEKAKASGTGRWLEFGGMRHVE